MTTTPPTAAPDATTETVVLWIAELSLWCICGETLRALCLASRKIVASSQRRRGGALDGLFCGRALDYSAAMLRTTVQSRCECQATLVAELNDQKQVVVAYAKAKGGEHESAPAHSIGASKPRFDVGWLCSICGRNVMRSFSTDSLVWTESSPSAEG